MPELSDQLLVVSILAYLAAMVAHAAEYAFVARAPRTRPVALVGATSTGSPTATSTGSPTVTSTGHPPPADRSSTALATQPVPASGTGSVLDPVRLLPLAARVTLVVAVAAHLATVVTRGLAAERMPWGNMYEYLLSTTLVGVTVWLWLQYRHPGIRHLGLYVALANATLLGIAGMAVYTPVGPLVPALDSYWFVIHIAAAALSSGIFLLGFVAAVMYLIRAGYDRGERRFPYPIGLRLPAAEAIERITFRLHAFGFPIWTFAALVAGPIWAEAAWGRYWGWDPKEVWAFITWIIYAAYLHARATRSVKRTTVAWIAVAGWLTMMMNLFGVNLFFEGLHSYA